MVVTIDRQVQRRLSLTWAVQPLYIDDFGEDFDAAAARIKTVLRDRLGLAAGSSVVLTAGLPFPARAKTNTVRVELL